MFALIKLIADDDTRQEIAAKYRAGGYGYGHAKGDLLELLTDYFAEARARRKDLEQRPDYVRDVLKHGAEQARAKVEPIMAQVREVSGLKV